MLKKFLALRIFVMNILLLMLPMLVVLGLLFHKYKSEIETSLLDHLQDIGLSETELIARDISFKQKMLGVIADQLRLNDPTDNEPLTDTLKKIINDVPSLESLLFTKKNLQNRFIVAGTTETDALGRDLSDEAYIQEAIAGNYTTLVVNQERPQLFITTPILDGNADIVGTLTTTISPRKLMQALQYKKYFALGLDISVVAKNGTIFASNNPYLLRRKITETTSGDTDDQVQIKKMALAGFPEAFEREESAHERLGLLLPIKNTDSLLMIDIVKKELLAPFYGYLWISTLCIAIFGLIVFYLIHILVKRLSKPLEQLTGLMQKIANGHLEERYKHDDVGYEINVLGFSVNAMVGNILSQMEIIHNEQINQEIVENELKIGHQIQARILPQQLPAIPGITMATLMKPALEVCGDFYDIFPLVDASHKTKLVITIADTAGKGVSACLYSLSLRSILRSYASMNTHVDQIIKKANNLFCLDAENGATFITTFIGVLDVESLQLDYHVAGHPPAIIKHPTNVIDKLWFDALPLGVTPQEAIAYKTYQLQKGDILIAYTDGVTEAMNQEGALFGEERLLNYISSLPPNRGPDAILSGLMQTIEDFENQAAQKDDITALILKIT